MFNYEYIKNNLMGNIYDDGITESHSCSVTIVTVCLNAELTIRKTIESVLKQSCDFPIEYIIIDGRSSDKTYSIICEYEDLFKERNIKYIHKSEVDEGIFDAMNKGISIANNDWVYFLGADDYLLDEKSISRVFKSKIEDNIGCIFCNTINESKGIKYKKVATDISNIYYKMPFSSQGLFIKSSVIKKYYFNKKKKVADYELVLRMYLDGILFKYVNCYAAVFSMNGYSQVYRKSVEEELLVTQKEMHVMNKCIIRRFIRRYIVIPMRLNNTIFNVYVKLSARL